VASTVGVAAPGVDGWVHARDLATGREVGLGPDQPVVLASVWRITVFLELALQAAAGELRLGDRVRVPARERSPGPSGISLMADEVELSLRDLAVLMMTVSDNTAADVLAGRVGLDRVNATLRRLGLTETVLIGNCAQLLAAWEEDVGGPTGSAPPASCGPRRRTAARRAR
jgi:beta-lactamase class A